MEIQIRKGTKNDLPRLLELIQELADFENEPDAVVNTTEMMLEDGFGEKSIFDFVVAATDGRIIGASIYYYRYSTWKGRRLYLEDLIVTEQYRGNGVGAMLFEETIKIGKSTKCTGMMWQVLDWNQSAIDFYKKYETKFGNEWINCNIDF